MGYACSAYPFLLWYLFKICVLYLIIKSEVWLINHCLMWGHETMVCAVCLALSLLIPFSPDHLFKCISLSENYSILIQIFAWWRHQTEIFSAKLAICAGNSPVPGEFPAQRPVTRSFDVFFDLRLNKRLSKQSWGWWFETLSCPLWRHCNGWSEFRRVNHWHLSGAKLLFLPMDAPYPWRYMVSLGHSGLITLYTHHRCIAIFV